MRLGPLSKTCIAALALVDTAFAADPTWKPISFMVDPVSPMFSWSEPWKTAFGGVTKPSRGQVGWGASQRVLDTADLPAGAMGDRQYNNLDIGPPFLASELRVYGGRSPPPAAGAAIFSALVNSSTTGSVQAPGKNGSALSIDLPWDPTDIDVFASGGDGMFYIDAIGFTTRIATNYSSVDQIPRVTEYFITDEALNPRLTWVNHTTDTLSRWIVLKGVAPTIQTAAGSPTASGAPPTALSTAPVSSPSQDSGPEDYWQAVSPIPGTRCDIPVPDGASFVVVNGTTGPARVALAAGFRPLPPFPRGQASNFNGSDNTTEVFHSANNTWAADTILFMRELDPTVRYTLSLQPNLDDGSIGIHSITYFYGLDAGGNDPDPPSGKSNTAAIAGGVVGGVVGGLLIALVALYFCVWRPRKRKEREEAERDSNIENSRFTPFVQPGVGSEARNNTVPPSYNPAWAGQFPREPSAPRTNSDSDAPLLGPASEKQPHAGGSGPSTPTPPAVPDWKRPYLPESHGGAALGAPNAGAPSGQRSLFWKKSSATGSSGQSQEKTAAYNNNKAGQNLQGGYSEGMLRAINPDP